MAITERTVDTGLGPWTITDWTPRPGHPLQDIVERIWHAQGTSQGARYRVLPHGMAEISHLHQGRFRVCCGSGYEQAPMGWYAHLGTKPRPIHVQVEGSDFQVVGARIHPALMAGILRRPLSEVDKVLDLNEDLKRFPASLGEPPAPSRAGLEHVDWMGRWLAREVARLRSRWSDMPGIAWMAREIIRSHGAVRISELESHAGVSRRRLSDGFHNWIGVTPKRFARIHRFRRVLDRLARTDLGLAEVALSARYYDQAHMSNDVREMCGLTPREFRLALPRYRAPSFRVMERPAVVLPSPETDRAGR